MTTEEFKQLENLLDKLSLFVGKKYGLIPNYHGDLCYMVLYNNEGEVTHEYTGVDLERTAKEIKNIST